MSRPRMSGRAAGSTVGAVGGLVFVLANAGPLPGAVVMRVVAVVLFLVTVAAAVRAVDEPGAPRRPADLRTYWLCVAGMVLAVPVGAAVLRALDRPELTVVWVVLVVGVHFLPFARAFDAALFTGLGLAQVAIALVGGAVTLATGGDAPAWTAVAAGFVLLGYSLYGVSAALRAGRGA